MPTDGNSAIQSRHGAPAHDAAVHDELERILASALFADSERLARFLRYVVERTLDGQGEQLKEYSIALDVFERDSSFDPKTDPIVRVQAGRLRRKLGDFYGGSGGQNPLRIELPKRSYVPAFVPQKQGTLFAVAARPRLALRWWMALAAALALAVVAGGWWWWLRRPAPIRRPIPRRMTSTDGFADFPAISPDGRWIAYVSDRESGNPDLWVQPVGAGQPKRLTQDEAQESFPDFAPDGASIAYVSNGGVYVASLLGGERRKIAESGGFPRFSPDGRWIAFKDHLKVWLVPAGGGTPVKPAWSSKLSVSSWRLVWSPDSSRLLFFGVRSDGFSDWWVAPIDGSEPVATGILRDGSMKRQGIDSGSERLAGWIGDHAYFAAKSGKSGQVWRAHIAPGSFRISEPFEQITAVTRIGNANMGVAAMPGGVARLVFLEPIDNSDLWLLPLHAASGKALGPRRRLTSHGSVNVLAPVTRDGKFMAFTSGRAGNTDILWKNLETGADTPLIATPLDEVVLHLSADGRKMVFDHPGAEPPGYIFYRVSLPDGAPVRICQNCNVLELCSDGARVVEMGLEDTRSDDARGTRKRTFYVRNMDTGVRSVLIRESVHRFGRFKFEFSPDDRWILMVSETRPSRLFVARYRDGVEIAEKDLIELGGGGPYAAPGWSPGGNLIYYESLVRGRPVLMAQRLDLVSRRPEGDAFLVYDFPDLRRPTGQGLHRFSIAEDKVVFHLNESGSTVSLMDLR